MKTEQTAGPVRLSVNTVVDGRWFAAGEALPYASEAGLPAVLKPFIASGAELLPDPSDRDIYLSNQARRQARRLEAIAEEKEWAEQQASEPLPPDVAAALQDSHDRYIGEALAQAKHNQSAIDNAHEAIAAAAEPTQYFVRRGGEWARSQNARLKPGESVFVRRPNGEMEAAGIVDSRGQLPPEEITP